MENSIVVQFHGSFQVIDRAAWRNGRKVAGPGTVEAMREAAHAKAVEVARKEGKRVTHPSDDLYELR